MGFINFKANCAICNEKTEKKYKIKKGWICPHCLEKAGGPKQYYLLKDFTSEAIKTKIEILEDEKKKKLKDDMMKNGMLIRDWGRNIFGTFLSYLVF